MTFVFCFVVSEKILKIEDENENEATSGLDLKAFGKDVIIRGKIHM